MKKRPEESRKGGGKPGAAGRRQHTQESDPAARPETDPPGSQTEAYAEASRRFQSGNFAAARELFLKAAEGPLAEVGHAARQHIAMCDKRLGRQSPVLETADDCYNFAVTQLNIRNFEAAQVSLERGLAQAPGAAHIHYALALCRVLQGDAEGTYRHLERAIEIAPENRVAAINDPDFRKMAREGPLRDLLFGS